MFTIITGVSGTIGSAVCELLLSKGWRVVGIDNKDSVADFLKHRSYQHILADVTQDNIDDIVFKFLIDEKESVDSWVNCIYPRTEDWSTFEFLDVSNNSALTNVKMHAGSEYRLSRLAVKLFLEGKGGSLVNLSSIYGSMGPDFSIYEGTDMKNPAAYAVTKGGVESLTRYIAAKYGRNSIRANCIGCGGIFNNQPEAFVTAYEKKTLIGRMADPYDIAAPVLFLLSEDSRYITGQTIMVDGGFSVI